MYVILEVTNKGLLKLRQKVSVEGEARYIVRESFCKENGKEGGSTADRVGV